MGVVRQPMKSALNKPEESLIACHDCDLLYRKRPLQEGERVCCRRCGALLYQHKRDSLERTLTLTLASLVMFILANVYPLLAFKLQGLVEVNEIISGVKELYVQGFWELALLVFCVSILAPLLKILSLLYVLLPLKFNRRPWQLGPVFRLVETLHPWAMTEVYMLGVFVAITKLSDLATIVPGTALYSFGVLIVLMAAADAALDPDIVWERLEVRR
jgi:paraquat-inducible protein A